MNRNGSPPSRIPVGTVANHSAPRKFRANGQLRLYRLPQPFARHVARPPGARRRVAFWLLAFVFAAAMVGATLPTPLHFIYLARWHFHHGGVRGVLGGAGRRGPWPCCS